MIIKPGLGTRPMNRKIRKFIIQLHPKHTQLTTQQPVTFYHFLQEKFKIISSKISHATFNDAQSLSYRKWYNVRSQTTNSESSIYMKRGILSLTKSRRKKFRESDSLTLFSFPVKTNLVKMKRKIAINPLTSTKTRKTKPIK